MHQEFEAPESLRDAIKCFWYNSRDFGPQPSAFEVVPDGYAEIIFHFGQGCSVADQGNLVSLPSPFMVGLLNQPLTFYAQGRFEILAIRCFPWTVFDLLGLAPAKAALHIFEHPIAALQSSLQECINSGGISQAIVILRDFLLDAHAHIPTDSLLFKAGLALQQAQGTLPVNQVAAAAHATVRTLERKFKQSSGHTVKDVSGLMRFEQVRNHLWFFPDANLARIALEFGYADQAHLSKEFKRYIGVTPAAFARNAKKGKPMEGKDFVAFVQA
jgi:AraC-like DNA-binding protein